MKKINRVMAAITGLAALYLPLNHAKASDWTDNYFSGWPSVHHLPERPMSAPSTTPQPYAVPQTSPMPPMRSPGSTPGPAFIPVFREKNPSSLPIGSPRTPVLWSSPVPQPRTISLIDDSEGQPMRTVPATAKKELFAHSKARQKSSPEPEQKSSRKIETSEAPATSKKAKRKASEPVPERKKHKILKPKGLVTDPTIVLPENEDYPLHIKYLASFLSSRLSTRTTITLEDGTKKTINVKNMLSSKKSYWTLRYALGVGEKAFRESSAHTANQPYSDQVLEALDENATKKHLYETSYIPDHPKAQDAFKATLYHTAVYAYEKLV